MRAWDAPFESECNRLVATICDRGASEGKRGAAWRALLGLIAPHIESWAAASPVLRRCGLRSEDEVRTVLVSVLSRMSARSFDNLHAYLSRRPAASEEEADAALVEGVVRLVHGGEPEASHGATPARDLLEDTPLRGWLFSLTRFAVKDHVKQRLGWSTSVRVTYGLERPRGARVVREALEGAVRAVAGILLAELDERTLELAVEYLPGATRPEQVDAAIEAAGYRVARPPDLRRSKRDLVTGAERLDIITEAGARPPITDALTLHRLMAEVSAYMETFPEPMRRAVRMWIEDEPFDAMAAELGLENGEKARALVRAGLARLRERFRGMGVA